MSDRIEELADDLEDAYRALGEMDSQCRAEVALVGDAWPGADDDLQGARDYVSECQKALDVIFVPKVAEAVVVVSSDHDLPF